MIIIVIIHTIHTHQEFRPNYNHLFKLLRIHSAISDPANHIRVIFLLQHKRRHDAELNNRDSLEKRFGIFHDKVIPSTNCALKFNLVSAEQHQIRMKINNINFSQFESLLLMLFLVTWASWISWNRFLNLLLLTSSQVSIWETPDFVVFIRDEIYFLCQTSSLRSDSMVQQ